MTKRVLLVEDNKPIVKVYKKFLEQEGYEVDVAYEGDEALEKIRGEELPDLILLDLVLPKVQGEEILKEMNDIGIIKKVPVIIISVKSDEENAKKCLETWGAKDYLIKSNWSLSALKKKIKTYLD
ncbi:MAG TPA: response regulator [Patescibacteria group bacterium]|nr:response regulator [Patescibacteria group bacterium]